MGEYQGANRRKRGFRIITQLPMCMRKVERGGGEAGKEHGRLSRDPKCVMPIHLSGS